MGNIYLMITIAERKKTERYMKVFHENNLNVVYRALGFGTVSNEILDYLGLETNEKAVTFSMIEEHTWLAIKKQLEKQLHIDAPGGGIAFVVPVSSIGGKKALQFLIENENYQKEEETTLKETNHELIIVIAEQGYTDLIMDAARKGGARGGTVIHAKGTGMELAEKFMHMTLSAEKEIIFIVTKTQEKNSIMQAIMKNAGADSKAKAITFSLPVSATAGLRLVED